MNSKHESSIVVSRIIETVTDPLLGTGVIGFMVTYPDGSIMNTILDYNRENYTRISGMIKTEYSKALVNSLGG